MKEGWQIKTLNEVCVVERGSSPRPIKSYFTTNPDGVNWIKIGDTEQDGRYVYSTAQKITPEGAKQSRFVKEGDFILTNSMSFGRPYIMKTSGYIHDGWFVFRLKDSLDTDYFYHLLSSPLVQNQFASLASGAIVKNISGDLVKKTKLPIPPLPEQQRIVAILDDAFESIAIAKANAEKNLQNAKALFESYLQGEFATAWQVGDIVTLADLATDITDGDHMPPPKAPSGVPFITIGNVAKDTRIIDFSDTFMVSNDYFNKLKPNKKPRKGDVLYTVTGSYGIPVLIAENRDFCFQRHIGLIRPKSDVDSVWLYYLLLSPQVFKQASDGATGTAQKTVSLKLLRGFQVPRIPLDFQRTVAAKLNLAIEETQRLESIYQQKITALEELKKALLHQAFSGQL